LFNVLSSQGWTHYIESEIDGDWTIWFTKNDSNASKNDESSASIMASMENLYQQHPELRKRLSVANNDWDLDVRDLFPPDPMVLTLAVLDHLPQNTKLIQINERTPQFLFESLVQRGFEYQVKEIDENQINTIIRHKPK